jgi:hypothetical protein
LNDPVHSALTKPIDGSADTLECAPLPGHFTSGGRSRGSIMAQTMWYDVVPYDSGWAIVVAPGRNDAFATRKDAFDAAMDWTRKLRFLGYAMHVRMPRGSADAELHRPELPKARIA